MVANQIDGGVTEAAGAKRRAMRLASTPIDVVSSS